MARGKRITRKEFDNTKKLLGLVDDIDMVAKLVERSPQSVARIARCDDYDYFQMTPWNKQWAPMEELVKKEQDARQKAEEKVVLAEATTDTQTTLSDANTQILLNEIEKIGQIQAQILEEITKVNTSMVEYKRAVTAANVKRSFFN